jgi:tRNA wybutosine-synthesizing protein 3
MGKWDPHQRLKEALLDRFGDPLPGTIPRKWEKFADVVILPAGCFEDGLWNPDEALWRLVADALGAERLGRMGEVSGKYRKSGVELLLGDSDWVERTENATSFGYHFTQIMWSRGNVNIRRTIAEEVRAGEVVCDLYAGIGYYTLPILVHSEAAMVHACEINPESVESLRWGLGANGVEGRCTIHQGDNRVETLGLEGVADRVLLGLLPSSEDGFEPAMRVLKPEGGVLHVHGLAAPGEYDSWIEEVEMQLSVLRPGASLSCRPSRVKSYAPHWEHCCLEVDVA